MEILIMAAVMIWEYETVKCCFNKLTADLCLSADKCSESPGPTSAWCCWTSSEWIESASLPRWRRKSCSPTSIASCWTKRSERGWSSTETSVTNLINRSGCYSDKLISITYTRWGRTNNQKAGPEGGKKKGELGSSHHVQMWFTTLKCRHCFYIRSSPWRPDFGIGNEIFIFFYTVDIFIP